MAYRKATDGPFGMLPKKTAMDVRGAPRSPAPSGTPIILEYIDSRAERGGREKFETMLNKVPRTEPELEDWLED